MASFRGGIRTRPLAWGGTFPLGNLQFDSSHLRIWGLSWVVDAQRKDVAGVRFRRFVMSDKVSVMFTTGDESKVYFATTSGTAVREALRARGWPIIDG